MSQSDPFKHFILKFAGLDAAGKTTTLYKLKLGEVVTVIPTIGNFGSCVVLIYTINVHKTM